VSDIGLNRWKYPSYYQVNSEEITYK